jgi:hypothetical protein
MIGPSDMQGVQLDTSAIPVYVAPAYQLPGQQQQAVVHEVVGYIQVPMQASAQQVYDTIQVGRAGSWQRKILKNTLLGACVGGSKKEAGHTHWQWVSPRWAGDAHLSRK